ncbi:MAG: YihY/virulence factor BrkB family protein [Chlorobi bacterium]|nr:YihY/virulence factor BrkB family protein [Chlorobiota bacterium]
MSDFISKAIRYLNEDIWRIQSDDTSKRQFFIIKVIRILFLSIKGFINDNCQLKASALTFYSLLSVVPVVAMIFGIAKGFGFEERIRFLLESNISDPHQEEIVNWIVDFAVKYLEATPGGQIAGIGLAILLWAVMKVLGNIEDSFNDIWEVKRSRSFIRKFSDYIALMLLSVLFLVSSSGMLVFISQQIKGITLFRYVSPIAVMLLPYLIIWLVFTLLLYIMPNKRVKFNAALFGGIISGTMFQLLQYAYIHSQMWVSKYNAIYGSFAALPLFLIWIQLSWLIVLFGAELSFAYQNYKSFEFDADIKRISHRYKRLMYLLIVHHIIKRFENGEEPVNTMQLSINLKLPIRLVNELVYELVESKVLSEVGTDSSKDVLYQPALDINKLRVFKVMEMVEARGRSDFHFNETPEMKHLRSVLSKFDDILSSSEENILLKDL